MEEARLKMRNQDDFKTLANTATARLTEPIFMGQKNNLAILLHLHYRFDC